MTEREVAIYTRRHFTLRHHKESFYWPVMFFLFLLAFFAQRLTLGTQTTEQNYILLPFGSVQVCIALLGLVISLIKPFKWTWIFWTFVALLILLAAHGIHAIFLISVWGSLWEQYLIKGLILWGYLAICIIFGATCPLSTVDSLLRVFRYCSLATVGIGVACLLIYYSTGIALLLHFYQGFGLVRIQAFMSEPSAWAPVMAFLCLIGIWRKDRAALLMGVLGGILTFSPIVLSVVGLSQITILIMRIRKATFYVFAVAIPLAAILYWFDCGSLNLVDEGALANVLGRTFCGAKTIFDENTRNVFVNDRVMSTNVIFDHMTDMDLWWSGLGLNSTAVFMEEFYGQLRDNALWVSLAAFYGYWGIFLFLFIAFTGFVSMCRIDNVLGLIWVSFFWSVTLNSAQGFYTYSLYFFFWILLLRSTQFSSKQSTLSVRV